MEFASNSLNQPVNFYTKNTGNTINMAIDGDNKLYPQNIIAPEFMTEKIVNSVNKPKRKRKNKRLNTYDTEYLPDETEEVNSKEELYSENIFILQDKPTFTDKLKKAFEHFITVTPLVNYFFMKKKGQRIKNTVNKLNDISQDVDELLNTSVPYGESSIVYSNIAKNLTTAACILGEVNKNK